MRRNYELFFWLIAAAIAFCLFLFASTGRAARPVTRCFAHGHTPGATVTMCVTHLGNDRCKLIWKWRTSDSLRVHHFGGIVMCGGGVGIVSDPGGRRPK
jgi:hypothetical protein